MENAMKLYRQGWVHIKYLSSEEEAVRIAAANLKADLFKVLESRVCISCPDLEETRIYGVQNGPAELSGNMMPPKEHAIREILIASGGNVNRMLEGGFFTDKVMQEEKQQRLWKLLPKQKEGYLIAVEEGKLFLLGTDRRGAIYAIYDFCEQLGVSPWYFFADVPVKEREVFELAEGYQKTEYPSVEYRGIFINDEEELEKWAVAYMQETTLGPKTYARVFELLLRLKCNYLWPAMHVNSFNAEPENGQLAEKMGIVIGTSHCDMLMRSNNREWEPWKKKKGYRNLEYDFSIEGENRERLLQYWKESVEQNCGFEVTYTLGMRGIHDSGFSTKALASLSGEELLKAKLELLSDVLKAQNKILEETPHKSAGKLFVPYKEVLELYDKGLSVPEDFTLIWTNDNYGHVRRYPDPKDRNRFGGHGLYYHNSYWAPPGASYLFLCTAPFAKTRNEFLKAYQNGIQKLWVTNFGAIKPLELHMSFYADLAFHIGKEEEITADVEAYLAGWLKKTFSVSCEKKLAKLLLLFDQVVNLRKVELMEDDVFYQSEQQDEAKERLDFLKYVFDELNEVYRGLPAREKDAFFQIILLRVHAAYYTNGMYYASDRSVRMAALLKDEEADACFELAQAYDAARRSLLAYYNDCMANGKWKGMVTPEDYPPPRTAMYPAALMGKKKRKELGISDCFAIRTPSEDKMDVCIVLEAAQGEKTEGVSVIPYLGRGCGSLVEFENAKGQLSFSFEVGKQAEYRLMLERFPSLNSVGEIGIDVIIDKGPAIRLCSLANDEHKDTWKKNVFRDADLLSTDLGVLTAGTHRLTFLGASRYFAFTRCCIFSGNSTRDHFYHEKNALMAAVWNMADEQKVLTAIRREFYNGVLPKPRQEMSLPVGFGRNVIANEDLYGYCPANEAGAVNLPICGERVQISGEAPEVCVGVGRTAPGLYFRDPAWFEEHCKSHKPCLTWSVDIVREGTYVLWICVYGKGAAEYAFQMKFDGQELISEGEAKQRWKYSSENVYKWIPMAELNLTAAEHEISFTFGAAKLRLEGICLTKKTEKVNLDKVL